MRYKQHHTDTYYVCRQVSLQPAISFLCAGTHTRTHKFPVRPHQRFDALGRWSSCMLQCCEIDIVLAVPPSCFPPAGQRCLSHIVICVSSWGWTLRWQSGSTTLRSWTSLRRSSSTFLRGWQHLAVSEIHTRTNMPQIERPFWCMCGHLLNIRSDLQLWWEST